MTGEIQDRRSEVRHPEMKDFRGVKFYHELSTKISKIAGGILGSGRAELPPTLALVRGSCCNEKVENYRFRNTDI